jgi:hypothetical protein
MAIGGIHGVDTTARIGHVHHAIDNHGRGLITDAVNDSILKEPSRRERFHIRGIDLIHRGITAAGQIQIVEWPIDSRRSTLRLDIRHQGGKR